MIDKQNLPQKFNFKLWKAFNEAFNEAPAIRLNFVKTPSKAPNDLPPQSSSIFHINKTATTPI